MADYNSELEKAKSEYYTEYYKQATTRLKNIKKKYDVVESGNSKKRRKAEIETQDENKILRPYDRLRMINLTRNIERNTSPAKSLIKQFKLNVVGILGKLQLNTDNPEANKAANSFFNKVWAPDCYSRDDLHFNDAIKLTLASVIREGDIVTAVDDFDEDDGKLLFWEADQLPNINEAHWAQQKDWTEEIDGKTVPLKQSSGVVYTKKGKVKAYILSGKRGYTSVKMEDATILPRGTARMVKSTFRFNQLRGTGELFALVADIEDLYEMRSKELQSAKLAATFAGTVHKKDATEEAMFRGGVGPESVVERVDEPEEATSEEKNYDNLEALTGGLMEYMEEDDEFNPLNFDRPNVHMREFFEFVFRGAGAGMGLAKAYTLMEAYNSYTAFRGEMVMSWQTFKDWQKFLERYFCDWVAVKVLKWAMRKKKIPMLPEGWEMDISWNWPRMPQVDPVKDNQARRESMKDGFTSFQNELGPDWKNDLDSTAEGLEYGREKNLPLTAFETKAGGNAQTNNNNPNDGESDNEQD